MLRQVESLMMILLFASIDSLKPPYSGELIVLLCSSMTNTCNNNLRSNCGSTRPEMDNLKNHFLLETLQPEDVVESNCNKIFNLLIAF